ncbi:MAG: dephospho-CoA kinase [Hyphomicrobiaceae bacterium]|nr:dephospho-CoA kinase [Hyphomicrobiaceae bacterium]
MLIIGLTGSIGMGKSTAAAYLRQNGIAVFDADAAVHALYSGAAVPLIEGAFPGTTANGVVDRRLLLQSLMADTSGFARLEAIVHPLVREAERTFLAAEHTRGAAIAVLEIPLLFETGGDKLVDVTVVVSAGPQEQRRRVLERPGMTDEKLAEILSRQMADAEKRQRADFVVDTSRGVPEMAAQMDRILAEIASRPAGAYQRCWSGG